MTTTHPRDALCAAQDADWGPIAQHVCQPLVRHHAEAGAAGLRLSRHYKDALGRALEITDTIYPADRVTVAFQLKRSRAQV